MDYRSPLESIFNIISGLPQGHDKPVKHALYNAVALLLLLLCCAAGWALYLILEPFIKPLIWALLVGSVLHPLKRSLKDCFQNWFENLDRTHTPIVLGVILLPVNIANKISDFIGSNLVKRVKIIIGVCVIIPLIHVAYYYTPTIIASLIWTVFTYTYLIINFILKNASLPLMLVLLIIYFSTVFVLWTPKNNAKFHCISIVVWLLGSCCLARQFGSFQLPLFIFLQIVLIGGFIYEIYDIYVENSDDGQHISITQCIVLAFNEKSGDANKDDQSAESQDSPPDNLEVKEIVPENEKNAVKSEDIKKDPWALDLFEKSFNKELESKKKLASSELTNTSLLINNQGIHLIQKPQKTSGITDILNTPPKCEGKQLKRSISQPQFFPSNKNKSKTSVLRLNRFLSSNVTKKLVDSDKYESTFYLYSIMWACIVMIFWKNSMLLAFLPIPILVFVIKKLGTYLGLWNLLNDRLAILIKVVNKWCQDRYDALIPVPVRGLYRVTHKVNNYLKHNIKESLDTIASCVVIFGLIVFLICASVFIALQIYAEAIMLLQITSNVINQTVVHNPEMRQILPPAWDDTVDSILDNAYQYGREGISKAVKGMMADVDSVKSEKLEKQILDLWDRIYQSWMSSNDLGPQVTDEAVRSSWEAFITDIQKSPEMFNLNSLTEFAKQNVGTLMSLLESVWSIVKGNISLVLGSVSAFLSVILGGGTAVLNFILNMVVFLTTLFYLLNSSGELYKPVELMTNFSSSGSRFGHALEGAINGVFSASFKMATFYGLWTWFIHNLFNVKIVYLPSAFATILGAIPFLGTYWACVPAVLDLWLAQDRGVAAILFALFQFLPTSIVDTTIYKEIKGGGHPYLTGLAIAGGIFCLGVEGAIMGPLLLCGLYVAIDLSSSLFKESPSEESLNLDLRIHNR